jgi:hypothetical protein
MAFRRAAISICFVRIKAWQRRYNERVLCRTALGSGELRFASRLRGADGLACVKSLEVLLASQRWPRPPSGSRQTRRFERGLMGFPGAAQILQFEQD